MTETYFLFDNHLDYIYFFVIISVTGIIFLVHTCVKIVKKARFRTVVPPGGEGGKLASERGLQDYLFILIEYDNLLRWYVGLICMYVYMHKYRYLYIYIYFFYFYFF